MYELIAFFKHGIAKRRLAAQYAMWCDDEVNAHYEIPNSGLKVRIHQVRLYATAFFSH